MIEIALGTARASTLNLYRIAARYHGQCRQKSIDAKFGANSWSIMDRVAQVLRYIYNIKSEQLLRSFEVSATRHELTESSDRSTENRSAYSREAAKKMLRAVQS